MIRLLLAFAIVAVSVTQVAGTAESVPAEPSERPAPRGQALAESFGVGFVFSVTDSGAHVTSCLTGGPADRAGLRAQDKLERFDGASITEWSFPQMQAYLLRDTPASIAIDVRRAGQEMSFLCVRERMSEIFAKSNVRLEVVDSLQSRFVPLVESAHFEPGMSLPPLPVGSRECEASTLASDGRNRLFLYYWASWCSPCKRAFPELHALAAQAADAQVRIVGVNLDDSCEKAAVAIEKFQPPGEQVLGQGNLGPAPVALNVHRRGIPTAALIDASGRIEAITTGADSVVALLRAAVERGR